MRIRQLVAAVSMSLLAGVAMAASAPSVSAAPRQTGSSATPNVPTSTVGVEGEHFIRYCVKNFAPDSTVTVTNKLTGATATVATNDKGAGCANVPIKRGCHAIRQVIVATGTDANGDPASSRAVVTSPPTPSLCSTGSQSSSPGSLAFTGAAGIFFMLVLGGVLVVVGAAAVAATRRRHQAQNF